MRRARVRLQLACWFALALGACGGGAQKQEVRALPPADPRAVQKYLQASALMSGEKTRDEQRAQALLHEALAIDANLWEARYNLGVLYRRRGELRKALAEFEAAHGIQPGAGGPLLALAEVHHAMGELDDAAEFLRDYVAAHEDALDSRVALTALLREQQKYEAALEQARAVLVRDPRSIGALLEVGRIYREQGELDVAALVFDRAQRLYEKDPRPHNELGLTALARGDTQLAFQHFERARQADESFAPGRLNRAAVLLRAGDYAAAADEYEAVLKQHADHDDARVGLAVALRGQGKHARAAQEYERVLAQSPNHAAALFDLAVLRAEFMDDAARARPLFERYVELAGEGPSLEVARRYLEQLPQAEPAAKAQASADSAGAAP
jgi:tetratricopeptide (TPR) repeat protein